MIVDCHCHAGTGDGFRGPWDTEARIEPHLARARAAGIARTVVFPVFNSDYAAANARLARIVRRFPNELIGFAGVNPARDAGYAAAMIGRAVEEFGFRGIKIHGFDSFPTREVCAAARRYRLPMLVDVVRRVAGLSRGTSTGREPPLTVKRRRTAAGATLARWTRRSRAISRGSWSGTNRRFR